MIVGYARVSTGEQNLDRQRDELLADGAEKVYEEVGSGKKGAPRPKWDEVLRNLRSGDTLVVTELSRLGRNTGQLGALVDELKEREIWLRILNLPLDTTTATGRLLYDVVGAVAAMERNLLIERTNSGLAAARARGRKGGRRRTTTKAQVAKAQDLYDKRELTISEIAAVIGVSPRTMYRYLVTDAQRDRDGA